jgi:hypothetical protein
MNMWTLIIIVAAVILLAVLVGVLIQQAMGKTFEGLDVLDGLTDADWKQMNQGLFNRYPLDYEVVVKVFDRETLEQYFGAVFDENGDILDLKNTESIIKGFVSSLVEMDGLLNTPAQIRKRLGLDHPSYDKTYGRGIYVMTVDLSDQNLRFDVPVNETAGGLALFQEGGFTSGGAREVQIMRPIPATEKIVEIRRVCQEGYGKPFTPNESSKHTIVNYQRKDPITGDLVPWNPWHDEDASAWAVALIRLRTQGTG